MLKSDIHSNYKYINKIVYEYDVQKKYVNENKLIFSALGCTVYTNKIDGGRNRFIKPPG